MFHKVHHLVTQLGINSRWCFFVQTLTYGVFLSGSNTEKAWEGESLTMTFPDNYQINVEEAFYGNHEKGCAGSDQSTNLKDRSGHMVTYRRWRRHFLGATQNKHAQYRFQMASLEILVLVWENILKQPSPAMVKNTLTDDICQISIIELLGNAQIF